MVSFPSRARFRAAVEAGNALLARDGFPQRGNADELAAWLRTDTPYPNPEPGDLLDSPYLVVHEIVEIAETQRRGLRITREVIVKNMEMINDAHRVAAEVELHIAAHDRQLEYVASRLADLRTWCEDPLLTRSQKVAYEALRSQVERWLDAAREGRNEEL